MEISGAFFRRMEDHLRRLRSIPDPMDSFTTIAGRSISWGRVTEAAVLIRSALTFTIFIYSLAVIGSCSAAPPAGGQTVSFATIDQGTHSGVRERQSLVIKSAEEWENLLQAHRISTGSERSGARIDFELEMVVAVFSGPKPSGGYHIQITEIENDPVNQRLTILIRESKPSPGTVVTQVLTHPYHIVRLKKIELPVIFSSG